MSCITFNTTKSLRTAIGIAKNGHKYVTLIQQRSLQYNYKNYTSSSKSQSNHSRKNTGNTATQNTQNNTNSSSTTSAKPQSYVERYQRQNMQNVQNMQNMQNYDHYRDDNEKVFQERQFATRLPFTKDEASKLLMNWSFVRGQDFLQMMRQSLVRYNKLSDKQLQAMRNIMVSKQVNKNFSAFKQFVEIDPIIHALISLNENDFIEMSKNHPQFSKLLQEFQQKFHQYGSLTHKQIRFAGNMLCQIFPNFNVNGAKGESGAGQQGGDAGSHSDSNSGPGKFEEKKHQR